VKPVNLLPSDLAVVASSEPTKPNLGMIGGAAAGLVALVAVAGYFAMARVDSVKSETAALQQRATEATNETTAVKSQVASLGQPVVDSDRQIAQGAEQVLVAAYTERHDFVQLAQELRGIMEGTGGWYTSVEASSTGDGDVGSEGGKAVTISGYMPNGKLAASFEERVNATRTLADAEVTLLKSERLTDLDTKRPATYWKFTIAADMVDTVAPSASDGGLGGSDATGTTVGSGGASSNTLTLSLDPEPRATAAARPATKPRNPFGVAAAAAVRGGGG
jgi:hypothetical protein